MADKKKKSGTSPAVVVLFTLLCLTVVTCVVVVSAFFASEASRDQTVAYLGSKAANALATESVSIKINMENCTMTVGDKVQATATIYPNGSTAGIVWTSSDTSVFTVDGNGVIQVLAPGIVALTANFGNAYDSIAIECLAAGDKSMLNLPDYSMFADNGGNNTGDAGKPASGNNKETTAGSTQTTSANSNATTTDGNTNPTKESISGATTATTSANSSVTATTGSGTNVATTSPVATTPVPTTAAQTPKPTKGNSTGQETTSYMLPTTEEYTGVKVTSTQIAEELKTFGFKPYLSNTYVYEEGDSYLGEIIISPNMTHIYIKGRSNGFDNAIKGVLTELLPQSNASIWNAYQGASSDQTVTVDGRVVRVVVPADGGHSQIVIYN